MRFLLVSIASIVISQLRGSSAAVATLQLPSDLWENSTTQINCTSDIAGYDIYNITEVRFWKENSSDIYFEYTKECGSDEFDVTNDTTGGRISFRLSNMVPTWVGVTSQDSGSYRCSLVSCLEPNEVQVSDSVAFTVHEYNTAPVMLEPQDKSITGYLGESVNVTFTCAGFTGYPPGTLSLIEWRSYYTENYTVEISKIVWYPNMTTNSSGYAIQTVTIPITFQRVEQNYFQCLTSKTVDKVLVEHSSSYFYVNHNYPPDVIFRIQLSGDSKNSSSLQPFYDDNSTVYLNETGTYLLFCWIYSDPIVEDFTFQIVGAPPNYFRAQSTSLILLNNDDPDVSFAGQLQCNATYKSDAKPTRTVTKKARLNLYFNYFQETTLATTPETTPATTSETTSAATSETTPAMTPSRKTEATPATVNATTTSASSRINGQKQLIMLVAALLVFRG